MADFKPGDRVRPVGDAFDIVLVDDRGRPWDKNGTSYAPEFLERCEPSDVPMIAMTPERIDFLEALRGFVSSHSDDVPLALDALDALIAEARP